MFSIRSAYAPPFLKKASRVRRDGVGSSRLARSISSTYGGDGDAQLARLMRISADDDDDRQKEALTVLLRAMEKRP